MDLIFVRHGKPQLAAGDNDPPLTNAAREQAEQVGQWLVRENIARVVCSPLRRACETAEPTSRILGLKLEVLDGLAEAGRSRQGYRGVEELRGDPAGWAQFLEDPISYLGDDPVVFRRGVLDAVASLFDRAPDGKVAVFTHGIPINVVISHALGLKRVLHFLPHYCSLTRISGAALGDIAVISVNETAHLAVSHESPDPRAGVRRVASSDILPGTAS
jgi:broad specificity phosphatase PhoE